MKWIILIVLVVLVYWLYTKGLVSIEGSMEYIRGTFHEFFTMVAGLFGDGTVTK